MGSLKDANGRQKEAKVTLKDGMQNLKKNYSIRIGMFKDLTPKDKKRFIVNKLLDYAIYILIFFLVIGVTIYNSRFIGIDSIVNILTLSSSRLVMALGIAGCIILTGTDLSAGKMVGFAMCICASLLQKPTYVLKMFPDLPWIWPIFPLLIVMVVCGLLGMFNGFCVAKFKLHPFIVTLATQLMIYGIAIVYTNLGTNKGAPIGGLDQRYVDLVIGNFLGLPMVVWYSVIAAVIMWFVWNKTVFGKNMFAVGCNEEAAKVSGVSVFWTITLVFALAGLMYGATGFLESARIGSNTATGGDGAELDAIAACVIGGVSFTGGVGKIRGVIMGVILLQIINSALVFLRVPGEYTYIVRGAIILVACAIDMRKYMVKK